MKNNQEVLLIPKIELGIVIDHIPAGEGIKILEIISRYKEMKTVPVTLGLNYKSQKLGRKSALAVLGCGQIHYRAGDFRQRRRGDVELP